MFGNLQIRWLILGAVLLQMQLIDALSFFPPRRPKQARRPRTTPPTGPNICTFQRPVADPKCAQNPWSCLGQRPSGHVTVYRCCPGYARNSNNICTKVSTRPTIVDKAKALGLKRFLKFADRTGLITMLANDGNFTVFAPSNRAFRSFFRHNPKIRKSVQELTVLLRRHIVVGMYTTRVIRQDQLLTSLDVPQKLRTTWSADKRVTVIQGARIVRPDQFAKNGVIHEIDKVIERTTTNAIQYLNTRTDLTKFSQILAKVATNLTGPLTVFAPTNAAFAKMRSEFWSLVSNNDDCLRRLVEHHLVDHGVHIASVNGRTVLNTREGSKLLIRTTNNGTTVANSTVITRDVNLTNGVLHVISDVIIPPMLTCK